jgi:DNA-binding PadR family transcriptional regulator
MANPTPSSQISANEILLGLVLRQPGSFGDLCRRAEETIGNTQYSEPGLRSALERLIERGLVMKVGGDHRGTPRGREHFRRWVRSPVSMPPAREELRVRVLFSEPEDIPHLIRVVNGYELGCIAHIEEANRRKELEEESLDREGWSRRARIAIAHSDVALWEGRLVWLRTIRDALNLERAAHEPRSPGGPGGRGR